MFFVLLVLFGLCSPIVYGDSESVVPGVVPVSVWHLFYGGERFVSLMDGVFGVVLVTRGVDSDCMVRVVDWDGVVLSRISVDMNVSKSLVWRTGYEDYLVLSNDYRVIVYSLPGLVLLWDKVLGGKNYRIMEIGYMGEYLAITLTGTVNVAPKVKVLLINQRGEIVYTWVSTGYLLDIRYIGNELLLATGWKNDDKTYSLITEINPKGTEEIGKIPILNETKGPIGISPNGKYVASIIMVNNTYQLLLGEITSKGIIITNKRVLEHGIPIKTAKKIIYWSPDSRKVSVLETTSTSPDTVETYTIPHLVFNGLMSTTMTVLDIITYSIGEGLVLGTITGNGIYKSIDLIPLDYVGGFPIGIERYYTAILLPNKRGIYVFTKQPTDRELYMPVINVLMLNKNNTLVLKGEYPLPLPSIPNQVLLKGKSNHPTIYAAINTAKGTWLFRMDWRKTKILRESEKNGIKKIIAYAPALNGKAVTYPVTLKRSMNRSYITINLSVKLLPAQIWIMKYLIATGWTKEVEPGILAFINTTGIEVCNVKKAYLIVLNPSQQIIDTTILDQGSYDKEIYRVTRYPILSNDILIEINVAQLINNLSSPLFLENLTVFYSYPHSGLLEPIKKNPLKIAVKIEPLIKEQTTTTTPTSITTISRYSTHPGTLREENSENITTLPEKQGLTQRCLVAGILAIIMVLIALILYFYGKKREEKQKVGTGTHKQ
ncbi:MAG: hypothetical protein J7J82_00715 [Staphylothermus sp.]|nr:hypothetical protein [Staphylothermus sp.]